MSPCSATKSQPSSLGQECCRLMLAQLSVNNAMTRIWSLDGELYTCQLLNLSCQKQHLDYLYPYFYRTWRQMTDWNPECTKLNTWANIIMGIRAPSLAQFSRVSQMAFSFYFTHIKNYNDLKSIYDLYFSRQATDWCTCNVIYKKNGFFMLTLGQTKSECPSGNFLFGLFGLGLGMTDLCHHHRVAILR